MYRTVIKSHILISWDFWIIPGHAPPWSDLIKNWDIFILDVFLHLVNQLDLKLELLCWDESLISIYTLV